MIKFTCSSACSLVRGSLVSVTQHHLMQLEVDILSIIGRMSYNVEIQPLQ